MLLVTLGGVCIDPDMHVFDENDDIIEGFYANGDAA